MNEYKSMYYKLFNAITDAVNILQQAQSEAEEIFISKESPEIILLDKADEEKPK